MITDNQAGTQSRTGQSSAAPGALAGIRVLDLTQVMSGPFCTMILADLGAEVIKVENPVGGDQTRTSWGKSEEGKDTPGFLSLNRNKKSVTLDLKDAEGLATFYRLVQTADVIVENYRPGVTGKLKIDYDTLAAKNPGLIYASISGFGQTGPYASYPGYDLIAQAMAGVMSVTGEPGGAPVKSGIPLSDLGAGMFCAIGILTAYVARLQSGKGQYLETSLFEAALAMSVWESTEFWSTGEVPQPLGSAHRMTAPYQAVATADGYLTIGVNNDRLWRRFCAAIERPELLSDPHFETNTVRMANRSQLIEELEKTFTTRTTDEWLALLLEAGVPAGPIRNYRQILDEDAHVRARGMVQYFDHPTEGRLPVLGSPIKLQATPPAIRLPPPLLGEHTRAVLDQLDEGDGGR